MRGHDKAWVVAVLMGLGHLRAAYPLRDLTHEGVVIYGSRRTTPAPEYRLWKREAFRSAASAPSRPA